MPCIAVTLVDRDAILDLLTQNQVDYLDALYSVQPPGQDNMPVQKVSGLDYLADWQTVSQCYGVKQDRMWNCIHRV